MDAQVDSQRPFDLNADQKSMQDMVAGFAREKISPFVLEWDANSHLPIDVIREIGRAHV